MHTLWISGPRLRAMPRQIYAKKCAAQVSHACVINPAPHPCGAVSSARPTAETLSRSTGVIHPDNTPV